MARRESSNIEMAHLAARTAELEAENRTLRRRYQAAVRDKEKWERRVGALEQTVSSLRAALAKAQAALRAVRHLHFGRSSERGAVPGAEPAAAPEAEQPPAADVPPPEASPRAAGRRRGAQPGHTGHGRRVLPDLPHVTHICTLPEEQRLCPVCGKPYSPVPGWYARSVLLDWTVQVFYHLYLRQRYRRDCGCAGPRKVITSPRPAQVIAKGLLSARAIARLCVDKFWLGLPLQRTLRALALEVPTLPLSQGGVTRTFQALRPLLRPLYLAICQRVREQVLVSADETTATVLAGGAEDEPPDEAPRAAARRRAPWWTWAFRGGDAIAFLVARHRDTRAACQFFGWDPENPPPQPLLILLTDCYAVYQRLARLGWIVGAYCWAHVRRKFLEAARSEPTAAVARWAEDWRRQIATLYDLDRARRRVQPGSPAWQAADQALRAHSAAMQAGAEREVQEHERQTRPLHPRQLRALRTLLRHWAGLTLFLDHPEVPLDNNAMERILRGTVIGRKNYLFFGSPWAAELAQMLWSILATAALAGFNPLTYLAAYLQACADNGGRPPSGAALARFLPWQASAEDRAAWSRPLPDLPPDAFAPRTPAPRRRPRPCPRIPASAIPVGVDSS
jgi:transposase